MNTTKPKFWEKVSDTSIRVFLETSIQVPFDGAKPEVWREQTNGSSLLELKDGVLYRDGKKVVLDGAKAHGFGRTVLKAIRHKEVLHPNETHALVEAWYQNLRLIPDCWKQDEDGKVLVIYFWAAGFIGTGSGGNKGVWHIIWDHNRWRIGWSWVNAPWGAMDHCAIVETT